MTTTEMAQTMRAKMKDMRAPSPKVREEAKTITTEETSNANTVIRPIYLIPLFILI